MVILHNKSHQGKSNHNSIGYWKAEASTKQYHWETIILHILFSAFLPFINSSSAQVHLLTYRTGIQNPFYYDREGASPPENTHNSFFQIKDNVLALMPSQKSAAFMKSNTEGEEILQQNKIGQCSTTHSQAGQETSWWHLLPLQWSGSVLSSRT